MQKNKYPSNFTSTTNTTSSNNNVYLKSLPNTSPKLKPDSLYSKSVAHTDVNLRSYIDYTFKSNRNYFSFNKKLRLQKLNNYKFELQQTLELNIEILFNFVSANNNLKENKTDSNKKEDKEKEELIKLVTSIKNKRNLKMDIERKIKKNVNELIKKNDSQNKAHKKIFIQNQKYNNKIQKEMQYIQYCKIYINTIQDNFNSVSKYINYLRFVNNGKKANLQNNTNFLEKFIKSNDKFHKDAKHKEDEIANIKENITYITKDNKLYKSEKKLCKDKKPDLNLIRVTEFYTRIIRSASERVRILKNSINNLYKTLNFLDLGSIANFNKYSTGKSRQKSFYEIEFSKLDLEKDDDLDEEIDVNIQKEENEEDSRVKCLTDKLGKFMDFDAVLNNKK